MRATWSLSTVTYSLKQRQCTGITTTCLKGIITASLYAEDVLPSQKATGYSQCLQINLKLRKSRWRLIELMESARSNCSDP